MEPAPCTLQWAPVAAFNVSPRTAGRRLLQSGERSISRCSRCGQGATEAPPAAPRAHARRPGRRGRSLWCHFGGGSGHRSLEPQVSSLLLPFFYDCGLHQCGYWQGSRRHSCMAQHRLPLLPEAAVHCPPSTAAPPSAVPAARLLMQATSAASCVRPCVWYPHQQLQ